jgi:chromate reductase
MRILAVSGSLRAGSFNTSLLRAAIEAAPEGVELELWEGIADLPLYDEDLDGEDVPESVRRLRTDWAAADAILFATPEYNYSVPGVLKNAIDWASRPYGANSFEGKAAAIMGASIGTLGTARAQYHLRQMMVFLNMYPLNKPEIMLSLASQQFDEEGRLTNEATRGFISQMLVSLVDWSRRLSRE